ncbi:MAG TPA: hypothetical protein VFS42_05480, partial [Burkholderiaceae bacterium]|nr:hypothetical protein [Burkholderiaceae bacterium]
FFVASMTSVQAPLFDITTQINVSFFSGSKREWLGTQTLVPANPANDLKLQRALTDMAGNAVVLWTQTEGDRTGLRSASYDIATKSWRPSQVVDDKLGGGADLVDFDFDECGGASAVWLQYEAGRPQEGAIVNVASNRYRTKDDRWFNAKLLEKQAGQVRSPKVALLPDGKGFAAWIQEEGGVFRVNVGRLN